MLNAIIAISQGQYLRALDFMSTILCGRNESTVPSPPLPSSPLEPFSVNLLQSGDHLNKSRMYDYSLRYVAAYTPACLNRCAHMHF